MAKELRMRCRPRLLTLTASLTPCTLRLRGGRRQALPPGLPPLQGERGQAALRGPGRIGLASRKEWRDDGERRPLDFASFTSCCAARSPAPPSLCSTMGLPARAPRPAGRTTPRPACEYITIMLVVPLHSSGFPRGSLD